MAEGKEQQFLVRGLLNLTRPAGHWATEDDAEPSDLGELALRTGKGSRKRTGRSEQNRMLQRERMEAEFTIYVDLRIYFLFLFLFELQIFI